MKRLKIAIVATIAVGTAWGAMASVAFAGPSLVAPAHHHHHQTGKQHQHGTGTTSDLQLKEDELSLKWLFVSLGISALIGAVAGEVLINLTGSRR